MLITYLIICTCISICLLFPLIFGEKKTLIIASSIKSIEEIKQHKDKITSKYSHYHKAFNNGSISKREWQQHQNLLSHIYLDLSQREDQLNDNRTIIEH